MPAVAALLLRAENCVTLALSKGQNERGHINGEGFGDLHEVDDGGVPPSTLVLREAALADSYLALLVSHSLFHAQCPLVRIHGSLGYELLVLQVENGGPIQQLSRTIIDLGATWATSER